MVFLVFLVVAIIAIAIISKQIKNKKIAALKEALQGKWLSSCGRSITFKDHAYEANFEISFDMNKAFNMNNPSKGNYFIDDTKQIRFYIEGAPSYNHGITWFVDMRDGRLVLPAFIKEAKVFIKVMDAVNKEDWLRRYGVQRQLCPYCENLTDNSGVSMVRILNQLYTGEVKRQVAGRGQVDGTDTAWNSLVLPAIINSKLMEFKPKMDSHGCTCFEEVVFVATRNMLKKIWREEGWGEFTPWD